MSFIKSAELKRRANTEVLAVCFGVIQVVICPRRDIYAIIVEVREWWCSGQSVNVRTGPELEPLPWGVFIRDGFGFLVNWKPSEKRDRKPLNVWLQAYWKISPWGKSWSSWNSVYLSYMSHLTIWASWAAGCAWLISGTQCSFSLLLSARILSSIFRSGSNVPRISSAGIHSEPCVVYERESGSFNIQYGLPTQG